MFKFILLTNVTLCFILGSILTNTLDLFTLVMAFEILWIVSLSLAGLVSIGLLHVGALFFTFIALCLSAVELSAVISLLFKQPKY